MVECSECGTVGLIVLVCVWRGGGMVGVCGWWTAAARLSVCFSEYARVCVICVLVCVRGCKGCVCLPVLCLSFRVWFN